MLRVIPTDVDFMCLTQKQVHSGVMSNRGGETPGISGSSKNAVSFIASAERRYERRMFGCVNV